MKAHLFFLDRGCGTILMVCVDQQVHVTLQEDGWCADTDRHNVYYGNVLPCEGSCLLKKDWSRLPTYELPVEAKNLVQRFLASNGKERGEYFARDSRSPLLENFPEND